MHAALAADGVTLVTPNRRLTAYHKLEFDLAQQRRGLLAWPSPDILPFPAFVERSWRSLSQARPNEPARQLIDGSQSQLLWEQAIRRSDTELGNALMNVPQAARQAASAWSILHAWQLMPAMRKFALPPDPAMFLQWVRHYRESCREKELLDAAVLPDALTELLADRPESPPTLPSRVMLSGFDVVTPQQHHLWRALRDAGIAVEDAVPAAADETGGGAAAAMPPVRTEFAVVADELRACAIWARQQVQSGMRRVAIVVPELQGARSRIARELADALMPGLRAQGAALDAARRADLSSLFNISLGQPLADFALVRDGIDLLAVSLMRPVSYLEMSALLLSPHVAGAERERDARARLDARLREHARSEISLQALRQRIDGDRTIQPAAAHCPRLLETIAEVMAVNAAAGVPAAAAARGSRNKSPATPHDWSRHFSALLLAWGFPGERSLDSIEYQVLAKFRDALASLAALATVQPRMRADDALQQLRRMVADTMFQPEGESRGQAPIQVLGVLESAGQAFDALWVTGLGDDAWPLATRPNPFIPAALQRAAGVPEASALASLALDTRITRGWLRCARRVVFSHSRTDPAGGEQERIASALIREFEQVPLSKIVESDAFPDFATELQSIGRREPVAELTLPVLPSPTRVRGGAGVMRDQAACPFRAFARHRLGAKPLDVPQPGPDAVERGNLLHRALYLLWGAIKDHAGLVALDASGLSHMIATAATQCIAEARTGGMDNLVGRFADIEHSRICRILCEWLEYERERAPFRVVGREAATTITLAGLSMDLRLDRMDRLDDGSHALIDYKTGIARLTSWLGARPDEPQLPLYFLAADEVVSALAFARVKRGERRKVFGFEGLSAVEGLLPDVLPVDQRPQLQQQGYDSWDVLTQGWESTLKALANDFSRGCAEVDPKDAGLTCRQCDLHGFCRVAELRAARDEYAGIEADDGLADIGGDVDDNIG